ncbi:MAG: 1-acyl-sn-glycerol-3-phosphate acyltransferase [Planctomycetes bacterium]|nr:1-acyl-sn-glycerol-3-phosphate acyltransferase [Planctomycetota bacterium]
MPGLDLARLKRLQLRRVPCVQIALAELLLRWDYRFPRRTEIALEGLENLPRDRSVFLAMNHTDRYNYWPLQYAIYRAGGHRYTATWVKGKYYRSSFLGGFMDATNNIPVPSRGYVIASEFARATGRVPDADEYRALRDAMEGGPVSDAPLPSGADAGFISRCDRLFDRMAREVVRLNRRALGPLQLHVLVFPQGTRSKRLSRGHDGLAQMANHLGAAIVPVGCNGSDRLYPGASPFSRGGRAVYRIGRPLEPEGPELGPLRVREPFAPLSREAGRFHGERFSAATSVVMERIDALLDPEYRFAEDHASDGVAGMSRFV